MNLIHRFSRPVLSLALALPGITPAEELPACEEVPVSYENAALYSPGQTPQSSAPIVLGAGPHLFIDDYLVDPSSSATRHVHKPERDTRNSNPVVTGIEDGCFQPYLSVHRDETTGRFRIWYGHRTEDNNGSRSRLGYLESADGIRWERNPANPILRPREGQADAWTLGGPSALIENGRNRMGETISFPLPGGKVVRARITDTVFYDKEGAKLNV